MWVFLPYLLVDYCDIYCMCVYIYIYIYIYIFIFNTNHGTGFTDEMYIRIACD